MKPHLVIKPAALSTAVLLILAPAAAGAAGDARAGKEIAERWCAACHLVGPEQSTAVGAGPTFASIAKRSPDALEALAAFLADPHPPMPDMSLTRQEIRDLIAYLNSLR